MQHLLTRSNPTKTLSLLGRCLLNNQPNTLATSTITTNIRTATKIARPTPEDATLKTFRPVTPGLRHVKLPNNPHLHKGRVYLPLTIPYRSKGGRDKLGHITVRGRGGGHRRRIRIIDYTRQDWPSEGAKVIRIEHDPGRNAHIALVQLLGKADESKLTLKTKKTKPAVNAGYRYIVATKNMRAGDHVSQFNNVAPELPNVEDLESIMASRKQLQDGNTVPLGAIPFTTEICNVSLKPGGPAALSRGAGTKCVLVGRDKRGCHIRLPSGEIRYLNPKCTATIGVSSNPAYKLRQEGKAGRRRWKGYRPKVRGVAMNAVDHAHGGGRGKSKSNKHPRSYSGKINRMRTRRSGPRGNVSVIRERPRGKDARNQ